jgi:dipeptidyl aminopeptidase/acylaminoacyl peptidase
MKDKFFFSNDKGSKLCGVISDPAINTKSPIITLCHGLSTSKDGRTYTRLEVMLNREGIATFRFDFFGHGESEGKFEDITLSEAVSDVLKAIQILKKSGYSKIGLMGSSFGGFASLMATAQLPRLKHLALKSPVSDYLGLLIAKDQDIDIPLWKHNGFIFIDGIDGRRLKLNYSFFQDAETIESYETIKNIKVPTLIVHGDADKTVPLEQSIKCARRMQDCRLKIIEGADHIYSHPRHFEKMLSSIVTFITDKLG